MNPIVSELLDPKPCIEDRIADVAFRVFAGLLVAVPMWIAVAFTIAAHR